MLNEFLVWWTGQLRSLLPRPLRDGGARRDVVRLQLDPGLGTVRATGRVRGEPAAAFPIDPGGLAALRGSLGGRTTAGLELELPPGRVLGRTVTLPLAAERDPGQVLRYEMNRLTPFEAADVHWSWLPLRRDRAAATMDLRLLLTPRAPLHPVLDALGRAGLRPAVLRAGPDAISLDAQPGRSRERDLQKALLAACALLALAAAAIPFVQQSRAMARTEAGIAALRPAVAQADALRRRALADAAGEDVLALQRDGSGSILLMLAALTDALGDDTALTDLSFRARVATISGTSAAAVRLIPALTTQPALVNTTFTAPVTRIEATRKEGFTLRTELAP